jgi:glutamate synthase domain-containing protein 2
MHVPSPETGESPYPARVPGFIESWSRGTFVTVAVCGLAVTALLSLASPWAWLLLILVVPFTLVGLRDIVQTKHSIRRNFPVIGHFRYVLESIRPEIRQYFVESDSEENPISREKRSIVYQRAKDAVDTLPFGTRHDVNAIGYEWINHSLAAVEAAPGERRVHIGLEGTPHPYDASILNVSAMSYGSLSDRAILALNEGARLGGFAHNTGEGGLTEYHLRPGGDVIWQIGTGYFGCRTESGDFDPDLFAEKARGETVRMIELKLSQGAKPGHGGILPGRKVTEEIARIRGVPRGRDVVSPPVHSAFSNPVEMMEFVARLRELSGGKPVGFKLCVGSKREFFAVCRGMVETGIRPDFITVDGAEGGTGAAPLEFSNSVGMPLRNGLTFVDSALTACNLRDDIRIIAAGKITTGFHIVLLLALGADLCNSARGMMLALGCVQALKCNTNQCPVGVATQAPKLVRGLVVSGKAERVRSFHHKTVESAYQLLGAAGLRGPSELRPHHIYCRVDEGEIRSFADLFPKMERGALLEGGAPPELARLWDRARADSFRP